MCDSNYEKKHWMCTRLNTVDEIINKFDLLTKQKELWGYRGQPGNYENLTPSLERIFSNSHIINPLEKRKTQIRFESQSVELFIRSLLANGIDISDKEEFDYVKILGYLQHYDGITRLLDWSFSPITALYFAVEYNDKQDGEVWFFNYNEYVTSASKQWEKDPKMRCNNWIEAFTIDSTADWFVCEFIGKKFPRLYVQNGFFSMTSQFGIDHADKIADLIKDKNKYHVYIIDKNCKFKLRRYLFEKFNLWHGSLYPDITGTGLGIKLLLKDQSQL